MSGECDDCGEHTLDCECKKEWINVQDRLPEINGKYLSWDGRDIQFQYFEDGYFLMSIDLVIRYYLNEIPFTHWMPLPDPPNFSS